MFFHWARQPGRARFSRRAQATGIAAVVEVLEQRTLLSATPLIDLANSHLATDAGIETEDPSSQDQLAANATAGHESSLPAAGSSSSADARFILSGHETIPNFGENANVRLTSQHDGMRWSEIFETGELGADDVIRIEEGVRVIYDAQGVHVDTLGIAGDLVFATDVDTSLEVNNIIVYDTGRLEIGSEANPISANRRAEIVFRDTAIDLEHDPEQFGQGLLVFGKITTHGARQENTFVRVSAASGREIRLSEPVQDWQPGDKLFLPDTRQPELNRSRDIYEFDQSEVVTIAAISDDGLTITLAEEIQFEHTPPQDADGDHVVVTPWGTTEQLLPHVANLSRNIVIRSENKDGARGHTLFTGRAEVDVRYTEFRDLGRTTADDLHSTVFEVPTLTSGTLFVSGGTVWDLEHGLSRDWSAHVHDGQLVIRNKSGVVQEVVPVGRTVADLDGDGLPDYGKNQIARYPVHTHHLIGPQNPDNQGYQFQLIGNSVTNADSSSLTKWGITIHGSHYGLIADNTVHNLRGAGIVTEDGSETGNVIEGNFVGDITGRSVRSLFDSNYNDKGDIGDAFWFRGPNNIVRDNVAVNATRYGYHQFARERSNRMPQFSSFSGKFQLPFVEVVPTARGQERSEYVAEDLRRRGFLSFQDNQAYASFGALSFYRSSSVKYDSEPSIAERTIAWHTHFGFRPRYSSYSIIDGWLQVGDADLANPNGKVPSVGMSLIAPYDPFIEIRNAQVENMAIGVEHSGGKFGRSVLVENSILRNSENVRVEFGAFKEPYKETILRDVLFGNPWGASTAIDIRMLGDSTLSTVPARVIVENYNRVAGDSFEVFYKEQAPDYVVQLNPRTKVPRELQRNEDLFRQMADNSLALTNQQLYDLFGISIGGQLAPSLEERERIVGYVSAF